MHHIVSDGWSMGVLVREVAALYEAYAVGAESPLKELSLQYGDYAVWQREWLQGEVLDQQLAYWREATGGCAARPAVAGGSAAPASADVSRRGAAVQVIKRVGRRVESIEQARRRHALYDAAGRTANIALRATQGRRTLRSGRRLRTVAAARLRT